ncbi:TetR family transcriptional regulator C-terminal domain-containing protein [Winogradskyella arenosi]|uniref:Tetracyclin repressor-like C-terminal domain-containing protein n=1 Tax=Winogradskyella arenosi TaxID=533325 RepID=A0A368ZDF0_9FLAO|nr:TetR family transcriptional regulator C-terminal domain-containing protein [Winogradskyella arenosi]RCW91270.1 hypothetical protein DFQ08_10396 [Winogradskyella arenosi]
MAKKKHLKQSDLVTYYMDYVLTHNQNPKTVYAFAKAHNFEEQKFYEFFSSFESLEESIFEIFFSNAIQVLEQSEEYQTFDARNKLLSFYFTFFEILTANRSYVVYALHSDKQHLKAVKKLRPLRSHFKVYIKSLDIKTLDLQQEQIEKLMDKTLNESAWIQFLITLKFWLDDQSPSFEKTDIFIEKSVMASFDIIDTTPLKSLIDFGKFIYKEKIHKNG